MSTKTTDGRLAEIRQRIDDLEARARGADAAGKEAIQDQVRALQRQEASVREALRKGNEARNSDASK